MKKKEKGKYGRKKHFKLRIFFLTCLALFVSGLLVSFVYFELAILPEAQNTVNQIYMVEDDAHLNTVLMYYDTVMDEWEPLETLYAEENQEWIQYKDIPVNLRNAIVAIEDKRFWSHHGVDWFRTASAVFATIKNKLTGEGMMQGGSTITQQLVKNMTGNSQITVQRKLCEMVEALILEDKFSKEAVLEMYLNKIYFGRNSYGIYRASRRYFNKAVRDLDLAECAVLVSITNNPSYYDPYTYPEHVFVRAKRVLINMYNQDLITEEQEAKALMRIGYTIEFNNFGDKEYNFNKNNVQVVFEDGSLNAIIENGGEATDNKYNWYTDAVIEQLIADFEEEGYSREEATSLIYNGGLTIYTAYQPDVQSAVDAVYTDVEAYRAYQSETGQQLQSGIVVIDNNTGAIVATSGALGPKEGNRLWSRAVDAIRPPASAIKPLAVYTPAMEMSLCTPDDIIFDTPFMKVDGKDWPKNENGKYQGRMTVKEAFAASTNTVAVQLLDEVGFQDSYDFLVDKFHISTLVDNYRKNGVRLSDKNYAPLALGGLTKGVYVKEMAAAYAVYPRNGVYTEPYFYKLVEDKDGNVLIEHGDSSEQEEVISHDTVMSMNDMMTEVIKTGTGQEAKLSIQAAGKTGTSNDNKDLWFCGYNGYYTSAVWCGYDSMEPMVLSDDADNIAAVIWKDVMQAIVDGEGLPDKELVNSVTSE